MLSQIGLVAVGHVSCTAEKRNFPLTALITTARANKKVLHALI